MQYYIEVQYHENRCDIEDNYIWTSVFHGRVWKTNQECLGGKLISGTTVMPIVGASMYVCPFYCGERQYGVVHRDNSNAMDSHYNPRSANYCELSSSKKKILVPVDVFENSNCYYYYS